MCDLRIKDGDTLEKRRVSVACISSGDSGGPDSKRNLSLIEK